MSTNIDVDRLTAACGDMSREAGITMETLLGPLGGSNAPVRPAIYAGRVYQDDWRWWGEPSEKTKVIIIDNVPSQANRLEAALEKLRPSLGLPEVVLDLGSIPTLPSHLPRQLSGFRFPHRQADAYLRDAMLDGKPFSMTSVGATIVNATADEPQALFEWFPQALLYGYWQSHLGKHRTQAKLARSWVSEIAGYDPAATDTRVLGLKGDPLNLSVDEQVSYDQEDLLKGWEVVESSQRTRGAKQKESLAEIGHGQVPFKPQDGALAGVSFRSIHQRATVSFAGLRRITLREPEASACGRALLVALGLVAHVAAFGRAFSLRSGCDLRPAKAEWTWLGAGSEEQLSQLSLDEAISLFKECLAKADAAGVTAAGGWRKDPLVLAPSPELIKVISATWPLTD